MLSTPRPQDVRPCGTSGRLFPDLEAALQAEPADMAVIVAGDWNTPPWSPFFRDFLSSTGYKNTEARWWPERTRFSIRFGGIT